VHAGTQLVINYLIIKLFYYFNYLNYFAKYRRQPHINSGDDSDQRQLVESVSKTMHADLNVSQ